jgi:hypothetical protein
VLVVGYEDGLLVVGGDVGLLVGAFVGLGENVGTGLFVGEFDGVEVGDEVGIAIVGFKVGFEHPTVFCTSATTASLHCPLVSLYAAQKNAPPLHENSPLL